MKINFEVKLQDFITEQLNDMTERIINNSTKNFKNRGNNPFCNLENKNVVKYMTLGRSFDSQLGNRLQNIAYFLAREKYGYEYVPNLMVIAYDDVSKLLVLKTVAMMSQKISQQKITYVDSLEELENTIRGCTDCEIKEYTFDINKDKFNEICNKIKSKNGKSKTKTIDLIYLYGDNHNSIACFEIKAGGNLDTKNTKANIQEIKDFSEIFSFFPQHKEYFATCYNNRGEGNNPDGAISNNEDIELLIGSEFWEKVLPNNIDFNKFIEIYNEAFNTSEVNTIPQKIDELGN